VISIHGHVIETFHAVWEGQSDQENIQTTTVDKRPIENPLISLSLCLKK